MNNKVNIERALEIIELISKDAEMNPEMEIEREQKYLKESIDLMKKFLISNSIESKFNIFDYCNKDKYFQSWAGYVHFEDGFVTATDTHVLIHFRQDYKENFEGKNVNKKGEFYSERYADYTKVLLNKNTSTLVLEFDFNNPKIFEIEKLAKVENKYLKEADCAVIEIKINDEKVYFSPELFAKFARFANKINPTAFYYDNRFCLQIENNDGEVGLIMPFQKKDTNKIYSL